MKYNLTDLRLFIAIAECQSLTHGAERAFLAPSSASHRIKMLEASLGTVLLHRRSRGVELTRAGEIFLRHARQVFARLEQMHSDLAPFAEGVQGHVRLWANTHAIHSYLPNDLAAFLAEHPQVSVNLEEHTSADILAGVARGDAEIGIVAGYDDYQDVDLVPYRADRLVLITAPGHRLAAAGSLAFAQVIGEPFVMLHAGSAIHTFTMNTASNMGSHLNVRVQVNSFEAVCRMVAAGVGVGLVPREAVKLSGRQPVSIIELADSWAQRDLKICTSSKAPVSSFARALIDHLLAE
ncbi:transcriptional regulator [Halopseudomonas oceani]|uniref:LysR family transcriptional regulator n=1 Tax=Halopseudomonas oceani TaxID=1708783 RepID=A0A2P4ESF8_9GAMM|nr:LysR family transcriptional regulator [Halopseudomonas oceani]POB01969.1 LysR family transcriptional regulator [Halopseudomonas oceani]GGE53853.1 transcriptional regulator [Halopseudomonas oceani]